MLNEKQIELEKLIKIENGYSNKIDSFFDVSNTMQRITNIMVSIVVFMYLNSVIFVGINITDFDFIHSVIHLCKLGLLGFFCYKLSKLLCGILIPNFIFEYFENINEEIFIHTHPIVFEHWVKYHSDIFPIFSLYVCHIKTDHVQEVLIDNILRKIYKLNTEEFKNNNPSLVEEINVVLATNEKQKNNYFFKKFEKFVNKNSTQE